MPSLQELAQKSFHGHGLDNFERHNFYFEMGGDLTDDYFDLVARANTPVDGYEITRMFVLKDKRFSIAVRFSNESDKVSPISVRWFEDLVAQDLWAEVMIRNDRGAAGFLVNPQTLEATPVADSRFQANAVTKPEDILKWYGHAITAAANICKQLGVPSPLESFPVPNGKVAK